jgi:glutamine synthetase
MIERHVELPEELQGFVRRHGSGTIRVVLPDVNGCAVGKLVPVGHFVRAWRSGFRFARSVLARDIEGENSPVAGFDLASGDSDLVGLPDLATFVVTPWKPGTAEILLDACEPGSLVPLPQSCRTLLRRTVERLDARGLEARVATELEFYLLEPPAHTPVGRGMPAYGLTPLARLGTLTDRLLEMTAAIGLEAETCLHEYAPGQLEINVAPAGPLEMADRSFYFRQMVKEVALGAGKEATFMAKPLAGHAGSGCHVHVSLWRDGRNLFRDDRGPRGVLERFTRGNQARVRELFALLAPNVNSYRRYAPGDYVPRTASSGGDDRTVAFRALQPDASGARLECRVAGADANPYLVIAAVLLAGMAGLDADTSVPPVTREATSEPFPATLTEALDCFERSEFVREAVGAEFRELYLAVKRQEWRKFLAAVTEWELSVYGSAL